MLDVLGLKKCCFMQNLPSFQSWLEMQIGEILGRKTVLRKNYPMEERLGADQRGCRSGYFSGHNATFFDGTASTHAIGSSRGWYAGRCIGDLARQARTECPPD